MGAARSVAYPTDKNLFRPAKLRRVIFYHFRHDPVDVE
jgi:hypothetical protein